MSLDGFVRSAGAAMGLARESFGSGGVALAPPPGVGEAPTGFGAGSGRAADAFAAESGAVGNDVAALGEHDAAGQAQLREALSSAGVGRDRMDAVIAAAVADVAAMGMSTNTVAGQRALVSAVKRHLEDTKATLDRADGDASTRAASANVTAAGYDGVGQRQPGGAGAAMGSPMPQMPMMPQMPSMPMSGGGMPMGGGGLLAPLSGLTNLLTGGHQPQASGPYLDTEAQIPGMDQGASPASSIPLGDVRFDGHGLPGGREAYSRYIAKALDVMGVSDPVARANWARGLETGLGRESGFHPMAVNRWDSNAHGQLLADGAPAGSSRGGLQTIPATFASNHQPGTSTNIYDPVANLCAGMNYLMRRYHVQRDGSNLSSVAQFNPHHAPQGY